ncbi:hypothetical protein SDJN02_26877, partial [Cucurbita argyrosperma subsp. argyrosperma]
MIVLIQELPQLHSTSAKREGFGYSSLRSIPHQWNFKFNSKASWKCFCNKNETVHEASQALSRLGIQTVEFIVTLLLLKVTAKPNYRFRNFFRDHNLGGKRNWLFASAFGFGFLVSLVFLTSILAETVLGPKAVNSPVLKEILDSSNISRAACFIAYCVVTPFLEETVYRGFLLASISTEMQWQQAVLVSSAVFSAAHLSGENSLQLFIIGCVLGCSYCWTGNL